ncbi:MAG TPA: formyltransferase family protein, partial [Patescibacteria group bacterium]
DLIEKKELDAEIVSVISNHQDAFALVRAQKHNLPTKVIIYQNKINDKIARNEYDQQILNYVKEINPDLILLSGWQMILGEPLLKQLQKLQIPVINQHPALLTSNHVNEVATSRGLIPVLRGSHVAKDAFEQKLQVSGISIHQILPGDFYDVGPVIMKAEVRIKPDDTLESYKQNMQTTEHLLIQSAIKRVVHVLKHNIDISKGKFIW